MTESFKAGYVALIGEPNAGKSTLLNHLVGQKISITSRRPQTTRHRVIGIQTTDAAQLVYVDTPGMHSGGQKALNRYLNKTADSGMHGVDVVVWLKDQPTWQDEDQRIVRKLHSQSAPVILALNKIDRIDDKESLIPDMHHLHEQYDFAAIVPISALKGTQLDVLVDEIIKLLPENAPIYPEDQVTDRSIRFLASEIIREKLIRRLGQEIPHALTIVIESFQSDEKLTRIHAVIWVEREGQKNIVIGNRGDVLKQVGQLARQEIEALVEQKVYLNLWVKVKKGWSDSEQSLQQLGYLDQ